MLKRLHHVGIAVRSADEALGFYRDALGLEIAEDRVLQREGIRGLLLPVRGGEVELLEPFGAEGSVAKFLDSRGPGLHHICFETDDCARELTAVSERGAVLIDRVPRPGLAGMIGFLHPKANHGVLVELATPTGPGHGEDGEDEGDLGIAEVAVVVRDRREAMATFARHFELSVCEGPSEWGMPIGARISSLGIGDARIAFLEPTVERGLAAEYARTRGEGLFLLTLRVDELAGLLDRLRSTGVACSISSDGREAFVSPDRTGGVHLRLMEGLSSSQPARENQR